MKRLLLLSAAIVSSGLYMAQDVGRVISSTPIIQQVGVPRQVCTTEQVAIQQPKSGADALIFYENRPVAYNVGYEFGGKRYSVQMPTDPGPTLQLQVSPMGSGTQMVPSQGT
jgi:uncharacterized protein YcfJ